MNNKSEISKTRKFVAGGRIEDISSVYFIGIGGIGMSALARFFNGRGIRVSGYDKAETFLTRQLEDEGIRVHYEDNVSLIDKEASVVVYTPAVPSDHKEYNYYLSNNYTILKRSDMLALATRSSFNICVAGTHGKTTTSCMIAHILRHSDYGCNAFLGGISSNYDTNFWKDERNVSVAEADEYDRSFLKLSPDIAVITAMDPDHLDIYGTEKNMQDAFIEFCHKIKSGGLLVSRTGLKRSGEFTAPARINYSILGNGAEAYAKNIEVIDGSYQFDVVIDNRELSKMKLEMGGRHNIENAIAATVVADHVQIGENKIREALRTFRGVKRRFEYVIRKKSMIMIDDYAHHPEELRALINGVKELYPGKPCTIVFQPHLYSRTRDLASGFAEVLDTADEVLLLPIYPAREVAISGVSSQMIADKMKNKTVQVISKDDLYQWVKNNSRGIIITAGAGDIDMMVEPVKEILINK
jgi:UDP-N-acetylmuramate--alanine ligase